MTTYTIRQREKRASEKDLQYEVWVDGKQATPGLHFDAATRYVQEAIAPGDTYREESPNCDPAVLTFEQWQEEQEKTRAFDEGRDGDNKMPTTLSFEEAQGMWPFMIVSTKGDRLTPNPLLRLPSVPTYEWIGDLSDRYIGHFHALPRSGGKMAATVEAVENESYD